jgi:hypothetical protein
VERRRQVADPGGASVAFYERRKYLRLDFSERRKSSRKHNGQAFILHIWDSQDCKINENEKGWSPGFDLVNYITHKVGITTDFNSKCNWLAYIDSF